MVIFTLDVTETRLAPPTCSSWAVVGGGVDPPDLIQFIAASKYQDERRLLACGAFLHAITSAPDSSELWEMLRLKLLARVQVHLVPLSSCPP